MLLLTGAALLAGAPSDQGFVLSLSGALRMVAALSLGLSALAWLIDPDGPGDPLLRTQRHFA
jgi:hypothetical protein